MSAWKKSIVCCGKGSTCGFHFIWVGVGVGLGGEHPLQSSS